MHADVDAGDDDGRDGEVANGEDRAVVKLGSAMPQVLTGPQLRIMQSVIERSELLKPLTEAVQSFSLQILQQSKLEDMIRENFFGGLTRSLEEIAYGLHAPRIQAAEFVAANLVAVNFRGLDQLTAVPGLYAQHAMTARWAESALGFGALTSWRVSLQADSCVERLFSSLANISIPSSSIYLELLRISRSQVSLTDWVVQLDATNRLLGEVSGKPLRSARDFAREEWPLRGSVADVLM